MPTPLAVPGIASYNSQLYLGGPSSPPAYVLQARIGNIKFNGMTIDTVDVSNQTSQAHRILGKLQFWGLDCNDSRLFSFSFSIFLVSY